MKKKLKVKEVGIPAGSQLKQYLPANYTDAFSCDFTPKIPVTPDKIIEAIWTMQPGWLKALFKLRNILVKPFGLQTGEVKAENLQQDMIIYRAEQEAIMLLNDKHLAAYLSIYIENKTDGKQHVVLGTVVKFHYWLGYAYFYLIAPFHKLVVKGSLKYILKQF